jgi:hypothetical protein
MIIGVKHKIQRPTKEHYAPVVEEISRLTLGKVKKKADWLESRVEWNGLQTDNINFKISENQYVKGCAMVNGKILRTLEVLVDGQAVLCCDDATGKTNLADYHKKIFSSKYSSYKQDMMCNTCSRARFEWSDAKTKMIYDEHRKYV